MNDRIIIGESDRAGLAISAPLYDHKKHTMGCLRWVQREDSFSLEQLSPSGKWIEVTVVKDAK